MVCTIYDPPHNKQLIAIVGPTAVGKTAFALELAHRLNGEIISADSRQVYRMMDIGTAKPSPAERALIPHHLIDVVDPDQDFSLAVFQDLTMQAIADISRRGKIPLLVGGTGQYLAAVLEGWQIPRVAPQPEIRARLEAEAAMLGTETLHARLAALDPDAAKNIMSSNTRRIIRALEVYEATGRPISAQQEKVAPDLSIRTFWLTLPAEQLYARIDQRVDQMMQAGLLGEVQGLIERGYVWELPSMSGLGYREFRPYFEGTSTLDQAVQRLKFDTHAFARRQAGWFRRLPVLTRLASNQGDMLAMVLHTQ